MSGQRRSEAIDADNSVLIDFYAVHIVCGINIASFQSCLSLAKDTDAIVFTGEALKQPWFDEAITRLNISGNIQTFVEVDLRAPNAAKTAQRSKTAVISSDILVEMIARSQRNYTWY